MRNTLVIATLSRNWYVRATEYRLIWAPFFSFATSRTLMMCTITNNLIIKLYNWILFFWVNTHNSTSNCERKASQQKRHVSHYLWIEEEDRPRAREMIRPSPHFTISFVDRAGERVCKIKRLGGIIFRALHRTIKPEKNRKLTINDEICSRKWVSDQQNLRNQIDQNCWRMLTFVP